MSNIFQVRATDGRARAGILLTHRGIIETPIFMPVASQGSVKTATPGELRDLGSTLILSNTYHLMLRPGIDTIDAMGGLHSFMGWPNPILTDSGGFQTYSLERLTRITEDGVMFHSHIDGSLQFMSPESSIKYQEIIGSDIAMVLDECPPHHATEFKIQSSMERTHRWAIRCKNTHSLKEQLLFAVVHGGNNRDLRTRSASTLQDIGFDGYAVGGLSLGETKQVTYDMVSLMGEILPEDKPRYLMGVGSPEDLITSISLGMDMFDCVLPTRVARNGSLFTSYGRINIRNSQYQRDNSPVQQGCDCYTCYHFSTAYIHHLFKAKELLAYRLATIHNLRFITRLLNDARDAISAGTYHQFVEKFMSQYRPTDDMTRRSQKDKWISRNRT